MIGWSGWKSAIQSAAATVANLVGQDIVARSISLTQAAGSNAVTVLDGAYIIFNGVTQTAVIRSVSNILRATHFYPAANNTYDLGTAGVMWRSLALSGSLALDSTDSSGTPGAATINKPSGRSAIALGTASVVITNSLVTAASHVFFSPRTNDATGLRPIISAIGAGSFTLTVVANCTADLVFDWLVTG